VAIETKARIERESVRQRVPAHLGSYRTRSRTRPDRRALLSTGHAFAGLSLWAEVLSYRKGNSRHRNDLEGIREAVTAYNLDSTQGSRRGTPKQIKGALLHRGGLGEQVEGGDGFVGRVDLFLTIVAKARSRV
jgi:hypothetical protein